jgi:hypothetical protein
MKVKMLVSLAASDWALNPGDETEVSEEVAKAWKEAGIAEPIEKKKETATSKKKVEKRGK